LILILDLESRASTPPLEERVTSFFARAKKEVTKKENTWVCPSGFTSCKSEKAQTVPVHKVGGIEYALSSSNTDDASDTDDR
jgi:hypothetical protein